MREKSRLVGLRVPGGHHGEAGEAGADGRDERLHALEDALLGVRAARFGATLLSGHPRPPQEEVGEIERASREALVAAGLSEPAAPPWGEPHSVKRSPPTKSVGCGASSFALSAAGRAPGTSWRTR